MRQLEPEGIEPSALELIIPMRLPGSPNFKGLVLHKPLPLFNTETEGAIRFIENESH